MTPANRRGRRSTGAFACGGATANGLSAVTAGTSWSRDSALEAPGPNAANQNHADEGCKTTRAAAITHGRSSGGGVADLGNSRQVCARNLQHRERRRRSYSQRRARQEWGWRTRDPCPRRRRPAPGPPAMKPDTTMTFPRCDVSSPISRYRWKPGNEPDYFRQRCLATRL